MASIINPGSHLILSPERSRRLSSVHSVLVDFCAPNLTGEGFGTGERWYSIGETIHTRRRVAVAFDHPSKQYHVMAENTNGTWPGPNDGVDRNPR